MPYKTQWYSEEKLAKSIFQYFIFIFLQKPKVQSHFFLYVKVLISLLHIEFFWLGNIFLKLKPGAKKKLVP
jgi:hypothetical protein